MYEIMTWPRVPWTIFDELESLQSGVARKLAGLGYGGTGRSGSTFPLMNIWSSGEGLVVDAQLPGVDVNDLDISVRGDELTLRGKVNVQQAREGETVHRRERPSGEFARTLKLPFRADSTAVKASYRNGVLRLIVPRCKEEQPRKIAIEAA